MAATEVLCTEGWEAPCTEGWEAPCMEDTVEWDMEGEWILMIRRLLVDEWKLGHKVGPEKILMIATFQIIESIVGAFGGFAQMLESTFMATHSSFFGISSFFQTNYSNGISWYNSLLI